jgi:hypothetical protein
MSQARKCDGCGALLSGEGASESEQASKAAALARSFGEPARYLCAGCWQNVRGNAHSADETELSR